MQQEMTVTERAWANVKWAEAKCNEAAACPAPWALGNLRFYQNVMVKYLNEYYRLLKS